MIMLDTTIPGADAGALGAEQLAWLDAQLTSAQETPTLLAMHHYPLCTETPSGTSSGSQSTTERRFVARSNGIRRYG